MTDAHCHLYEFEDLDVEVQKFRDIKGTAMICCGGDLESSKKSVEIAQKYPEVYAAVGVHPEHQHELIVDSSQFLEVAKKPKVVAIGECGLDYYETTSQEEKEFQKKLLQFNVDLAQKTGLPLVVHCRNAFDDIFQSLNYDKVQMHCFTGSNEQMIKCVNNGWYISFGGIITFKKSNALREVVMRVPEDRLLIETDSPYLSPEPRRGDRNTPANVKIVAEGIAKLRNISIDEVDKITTANIRKLFKL